MQSRALTTDGRARRPLLASAVLALGMLLGASALADPPPTTGAPTTEAPTEEAAFMSMLSAIDGVPTRAELDAHFTDVGAQLRAVALDDEAAVWPRRRAILMLGMYPEAATREVLLTLSASEDVEVRRHALYTLSASLLTSEDVAVVAAVERGLQDPSPEVAEMVIRSLRWVDDPVASTLLEGASMTVETPLRSLVDEVLVRRAERVELAR